MKEVHIFAVKVILWLYVWYWRYTHGLTVIYCEFIIIRGIPIFVYFVDSIKPAIQRIFVSIYACTHYSRGSTNLHIYEYRICTQTTKNGIHEIKLLNSSTFENAAYLL